MNNKQTTIGYLFTTTMLIAATCMTSCDAKKNQVEISKPEELVPLVYTKPVAPAVKPSTEKREKYVTLALELPTPIFFGTPKDIRSENLEAPGSRRNQPTK